MGVYARIETTRGIWKAPAGDEANLLNVLDVEYRLSDADHTRLVKEGSVNGIRPVPGAGVIVDASRTLSTDTRWLYVNVRLLFNYVKSSLKGGLGWARQEPNRESLWNAIRIQSVTPFLMGLWRQGAFGSGTPAQVFTVICDASNNPPDQVDQGNLKVEVYFYPSKPAETIVIVVGQQPSGATASEA
jgi:phage tail sheath protein FI